MKEFEILELDFDIQHLLQDDTEKTEKLFGVNNK
jgi:hypothetical protein